MSTKPQMTKAPAAQQASGALSFSETLKQLELVLAEERQALRKLDNAAIDAATARKTTLEADLRGLLANKPTATADDRAALGRIRSALQANQLLLVHARACVRGALALAGVESQSSTYNPTAKSPAATAARTNALRVDMRG